MATTAIRHSEFYIIGGVAYKRLHKSRDWVGVCKAINAHIDFIAQTVSCKNSPLISVDITATQIGELHLKGTASLGTVHAKRSLWHIYHIVATHKSVYATIHRLCIKGYTYYAGRIERMLRKGRSIFNGAIRINVPMPLHYGLSELWKEGTIIEIHISSQANGVWIAAVEQSKIIHGIWPHRN